MCQGLKWHIYVESLREAQSQNKDLSRQAQDLQMVRVQLETERNNTSEELADVRDALKDTQTRLELTANTLTQLKMDFEQRLREKDGEVDNIR